MSDWNADIIEEFRANEGRVGGPFEGANMILISTVGARTGAVRTTPVVYFPQEDGSMLIVASKGGAPTNPDWYHNVRANPVFEVEVGARRFAVEAAVLTPEERAVAWPRIVEAAPGFGDYQRKTDRIIPVVRLTPKD
ncbi:nitroreductase family deazaflavin-dependent oxidoreductase [Xylanimonas sp. McL0601]|uniref:nitroreductase family deazaflavin-dependent oxidoreductase n=1 Tax=Xylanimonas sp. McL0601 TaxID=3414739 RepID=UPI003CEF082A